MNAVVLMDADGSLYQSCVCKKEDTEDGKGFIYDIEDAKSKFEEKVYSIINTLEDQYQFNIVHTIIFLEGYGNYRYGLNKDYKSNRNDREKPPLLIPLKEWVIDEFNQEPLSTFLSINVETDDSVAATYRKYQINDFDTQLIIASPDKDLKTIPCLLFDSYWSRMELSSVDDFEAWYNLMSQMIIGDKADGVTGIYGKGKAFVDKHFKGCTRKIELTWKVYSLYKKEYKDRAKVEWNKNFYSLKLNDANIATPDIESLIF